VLDVVVIARVPLACVIELFLQYFQQTGMPLLRSLSIRRHGEKTLYFVFKWLHGNS
jgi:hypothetical protein